MSYYQKPNIILTNHAIDRINFRLQLSSLDLAQKHEKILQMFERSYLEFVHNDTYYYEMLDKRGYYFIIQNNVLITITKMSYNKKMEILNTKKDRHE